MIIKFLRPSTSDDNKRISVFYLVAKGKKRMLQLSFDPVATDGGAQLFARTKSNFKLIFFLR